MESPEHRKGDNLYPVTFSAEFGDHRLDLDVPEGVWNPTPHGMHLGNMLLKLDFTGRNVLELGTGCGIHAILIARRGAARMTLTEIDRTILRNARHNLEKHGVNIPVEYVQADWTSLPDADFDGMVTNPPFTKSGKRYRRYFIDTFILNAHKLVRPGGTIVFVQSSMADIPRTVGFMKENGLEVEVIGETSGPFRDYYFEDPAYRSEIASFPGAYFMQEGVPHERLIVLQGTLPT